MRPLSLEGRGGADSFGLARHRPSLILMGLARKVWAVLNRWLRGTVQLRGSCAVVTGGSAGIGRAVVRTNHLAPITNLLPVRRES